MRRNFLFTSKGVFFVLISKPTYYIISLNFCIDDIAKQFSVFIDKHYNITQIDFILRG